LPRKPSINTDAPEGWFLAGTHPHQYKAELDRAVFHSGTRSCSVTCIAPKPSGWTTLMQNMTGREYCGKRLRMTCWVRAENVGYISGWLRIDAGETTCATAPL
jgi:AraC family transcriptional regulator